MDIAEINWNLLFNAVRARINTTNFSTFADHSVSGFSLELVTDIKNEINRQANTTNSNQ